jgi:hypothetical protein
MTNLETQMKRILTAVLMCAAMASAQTAISVKSLNKIRFVSQYLTPGQNVPQAIYNACNDATNGGTQFGNVIIEAQVGAGWSLSALPLGCTVEDHRGNGGSTQTAFNNGLSYYLRAQNLKNSSTLSLPSLMYLEFDPWKGGFSNIAGTKTQWQAIRIQMYGRTVGERKGIESNTICQAIGDCIGGMFSTLDWGGYSTGGDEGSVALRGQSSQGDPGVAHGNFPVGQTTGNGGYGANYIAAAWTGGSNAYLGEGKWAINTDWNVYSTGTLVSGSGVSPACTLVGSGTSWTTLGTGAHTDLALEYVPYGDGVAKWIVPVNTITDNTHLNITLAVSELGNSCFNPNGAYRIYKASQIVSLGDPVVGNGVNPIAVQLTQASVNVFRFNDHIEVPFAPNFHPRGVTSVVSKVLNGPNGGGAFFGTNIGTPSFRDGFRLAGNFDYGLGLDSGTTMINAIKIGEPISGALIDSTDTTIAIQSVLQLLSSGLQVRGYGYNRTNDWFVFNGGQYFSGGDARFGIGTNPQTNVLGYMFYNNAAWNGIILAPNVAPNAGVAIFDMAVAGSTRFKQENLITHFANGDVLKGWSDQLTTLKWQISGVDGGSSFAGAMQVGTGQSATGVALLVKGVDTGAQTIAATPKAGSGAYVILSNDSSGNPMIGTTTGGNLDHVPETDFVIQTLATTHDTLLKANGIEYMRGKPSGIAQFPNGMELTNTTTKPTCAVGVRGTMWITPGAGGVKDAVEVCAKDAADAYAWRTIY